MKNIGIQKVNKKNTTQKTLENLRKYIDSIDNPVLPNEVELSKSLGVSRLTVREAITVLEHEGIVSRVQGKGTLINSFVTKLENRIDIGSDIEGTLRKNGYKVRFDVTSFEIRRSTETESSKLDIGSEQDLLIVEKLLYANDTVAAIYIDRIPLNLIQVPIDSLKAEDFKPSIFPIVEDICHMNISHDVVEMFPHSSDVKISSLFKISLNTALLGFDVLEYSKNNIALMYNTEYYTDDFVRFTLCRNVAFKG